jgi:hypothetical protein
VAVPLIRALREVDHVVDMLTLPIVENMAVLVLRFEEFDLQPVGLRTVLCDEVNGMGRIEQRRKHLPAAVHQPSCDE